MRKRLPPGQKKVLVPLTSWGSPDERQVLDRAAVLDNKARSAFMLKAGLRAARRTYKKHRLEWPESVA